MDHDRSSYFPGDVLNANSQFEVPEMYKLMESGASVTKIMEMLFRQSAEPGNLYLGFKHLLDSGSDGRAVLNYIAQNDTGRLGEIAKEIITKDSWIQQDLERMVGIPNRFHNTIDAGKISDEQSFYHLFQSVDQYLRSKGIDQKIPLDSRANIDKYFSYFCGTRSPAQLSGRVEEETMVVNNTFATHEPGYLELNGPEEILRLRNKENPNLLLLGSMGMYSAREFSAFVQKINPQATPNVIDKNATDYFKKYAGERNLVVTAADALRLPFKSGSMDQVYTNFLLHAFFNDDRNEMNKEIMSRLFREVSRVLGKDGSFVLIEMPFGLHVSAGYSEDNTRELRAVALQTGFSIASEQISSVPRFATRPDIIDFKSGKGGARLDNYGFGHYGDKLLELSGLGQMGFRLKKENK